MNKQNYLQSVAEYAKDVMAFLDASPSPFHAVKTAASRFARLGWHEVVETDPWPTSPGGYYLIRDGAIVSWYVQAGSSDYFRIIGAHTDSPTLRLKPGLQVTTTADGWHQVGVEVYGGTLYNTWLDRDLGIAGRLIDQDGRAHLVKTGPILRIPQLAIHLDRGANEGLKLDPQSTLHPVLGRGGKAPDLKAILASQVGLSADEIMGSDLVVYDTQPAALTGVENNFLVSARQDNLVSVHAGVVACEHICQPQAVTVFAAFDHEEVGSESRTGACGPLLESVLRRISAALGKDEDDYHRMIAASTCLSVDAGHGVHPNYPQKHDPDTRPVHGDGPILKINANQRYSTDGKGEAMLREIAQQAGCELQVFVSRNNVPCGSTIAPLTATRIGVHTIDFGIPMLAMHSIREMTDIKDGDGLTKILASFYNWSNQLPKGNGLV